MKLKYTYVLFIAALGWILLRSDSSGRTNKTTPMQACGAAGCHAQATGTTTIDSIMLVDSATQAFSSQYIAGRTYYVGFVGNYLGTVNMRKFGFILNNGGKGTFVNPPASTTVNTSGGISYWGHSAPKDSALRIVISSPMAVTYYYDTIRWVAPATGSGTVTFAMLLNAVNGDGNTTSDRTATGINRSYTEYINNASVSIARVGAGVICPGTNVTYRATPTNPGTTPTYQWKINNTNVGTGGTIFTTNTLTNGDTVRCIMTSSISGIGNNPAKSNDIIVVVNPPFNNAPTITASANPVCAGDTITYTCTPSAGSTGVQYRWFYNTTLVAGPSPTANTYKRNGGFVNNDSVRCQVTVTNACATPLNAFSNTIKMTVNPSPVISNVVTQNLCNGDSTAATAWTSSMPSTTYTWTNNNPAIGIAASGSGQIGKFKVTNTSNIPDTAIVVVTPFASGCKGTSATYRYIVQPVLRVLSPTNTTHCHGTSVNISIPTIPAGASVSWTNDNTAIGLAASGSTKTLSFTATNTSADSLVATITAHAMVGSCVGVDSTFRIVIYRTPVMNTIPNESYCQSETVPASNFSSNFAAATYSWTNTNTAIGLAASGTGNYSSFSPAATGTATVSVTAAFRTCVSTPATYTIQINAPSAPTLTIGTLDTLVCPSGTAKFTSQITNGGTAPQYTWYRNGTIITGATLDSLMLTGVNPGDSVRCKVKSNSSCAVPDTAYSNTIKLGTLQAATPKVSISTIGDTVCGNGVLNVFSTVTNGGTSPTYKWYVNSVLQSGSTGSSYLTTSSKDKDTIYCLMTSSITCATPKSVKSNLKIIRVFPIVNVGIMLSKSANNICSDDLVTFTDSLTGGKPLNPSVKWYLNNQLMSTNLKFVTLPINSEYDLVEARYHSGHPCQNPSGEISAKINVDTVKQGPFALYEPNKYKAFCDGDSAQVRVFGGQPQYSYSWSNGNTGTSFYSKETESFILTISEPNNKCKRKYGPLTTYKEPKPTTPVVEKIDRDSSAMYSSLADNYQWQLNKLDIFGASDRKYNFVLQGMYRVRTTNAAGCIAYSDEIDPFKFGAGVVSTTLSDLSIYPNPVENLLTIASSKNSIASVKITDMLGREVMNIHLQKQKTQSIDLSPLVRGHYMLQIEAGGSTYYQQIEKR